MKRLRILMAVILLLVACNQRPPTAAPSLEISGTVEIASDQIGSASTSYRKGTISYADADIVPGEVIVRFRPSVSLQSVSRLSVGGVSLQHVQSLGVPNTQLFKAQANRAGTLELIRALESRPDVLWAQPNTLMHGAAVPRDERYHRQWHYPAINLPQAWDIETGTTNPVTVAVVDSGILSQHPDFVGKLLPGYDMISDPQQALDGDGRDPNPEDPGDRLFENPDGSRQSTYHGSHIAGTIAAATNNSIGVAGVSWGAKIVPVRVLGRKNSGTTADIADALLWAVGLSVSGVPKNLNPAQVINLSVSGKRECTPLEQEAINLSLARGVAVVVSAMNKNEDVANYAPASCSGVIAVGATDYRNHRAYYSNYGPRIDLMAPGGDLDADLNQDGRPDGVLSILKDDATDEFAYWSLEGTSMAAPHVAGVLALMKSVVPSLSPSQALDILKRTARPLSDTACTGKGPSLPASACGAGLVDAHAALKALKAGAPKPTRPNLNGTYIMACVRSGDGCDESLSKTIRLDEEGESTAYVLEDLEAGSYQVMAWKDSDANKEINIGDYLDTYSEDGITTMVSPPAEGIHLVMTRIQKPQTAQTMNGLLRRWIR